MLCWLEQLSVIFQPHGTDHRYPIGVCLLEPGKGKPVTSCPPCTEHLKGEARDGNAHSRVLLGPSGISVQALASD